MRGSWRMRLMRTSDGLRRGGACLSVALLVFGGWTNSASAQSGPRVYRVGLSREEQKGFLDDLSNSREFGRSSSSRRRETVPTDNLSAPTPEMKKIRPLIDEFETEISLLNSALSNELSQNRTISSLLSDSYMVTADVIDLSKRAKVENDHKLLLDDLRHIDASWGELSHRLKGVRELSKKTEDHVANLDDIATDVRNALDIGQQVNYRDLSTKTIGLATDLENLIDDIQYELHTSQQGTQLTASTGQRISKSCSSPI